MRPPLRQATANEWLCSRYANPAGFNILLNFCGRIFRPTPTGARPDPITARKPANVRTNNAATVRALFTFPSLSALMLKLGHSSLLVHYLSFSHQLWVSLCYESPRTLLLNKRYTALGGGLLKRKAIEFSLIWLGSRHKAAAIATRPSNTRNSTESVHTLSRLVFDSFFSFFIQKPVHWARCSFMPCRCLRPHLNTSG